ncbi:MULTISPECIES: metalloregulator ArsR/SmtB family transcription factor [Ensifer]|jgi:rhodanese-related sulfurtransferase|uniref:Metalloregulator ArsR/SmtB family transcription factor n=1 Tax=Ensifer canadensis TaxID=555315 RepID=A0AAW4FJ69_9HYPH|nr:MULTISPECIES: metalloregulator ArsR/SmtB family transcription factor [Ensifer]AHK43550.1 putative ArsR family transcriptional regulator [Ensifer adhaerens OV14]MDP9628253.1 rhodanese-related sulfurtransferase/DNA-binding HxlR family transcriptional regulator [Ensifer adhaerens]KQU71751.1 ArsR family transcriptional regulator [Ensifer sp. Root31]KQW62621.1 ArsR family transcriptional regulator [Ensifer sp. Root1252]KQW84737.1 ArsR family transcriptional regulator [Ensifer sp. Root127]
MTDLQLHIFEEFAELARTLASPQRLLLLEHIAQGERSVERLAELAGLSIANASQHLQQLRRAGFVETRRDGKRVLYRLGAGPVIGLLSALRQYAEHNRAQIRELVADRLDRPDRLEAISREELLLRMRGGDVTLLDVRPQDEFLSGHLPGAINIPIAELERRLAELPEGGEIVAYCRGPYCALSFDAVRVLQGNGFTVRRLESGFPDWKAAGLAVESRDLS